MERVGDNDVVPDGLHVERHVGARQLFVYERAPALVHLQCCREYTAAYRRRAAKGPARTMGFRQWVVRDSPESADLRVWILRRPALLPTPDIAATGRFR